MWKDVADDFRGSQRHFSLDLIVFSIKLTYREVVLTVYNSNN